MKMRKSTRETKNMIQTALWLPRDMHEKLKKDGGERGLGEEIRRRLLSSFGPERLPRDDTTQTLLEAIREISQNLAPVEPWHAHRFAFNVFKAAIGELLLMMQPSIETSENTSKLETVYGSHDPETIGRILAHVAMS
jgi:hypothetical protein